MIPTLHIQVLGEFRLLWPDSTEAQAHSRLSHRAWERASQTDRSGTRTTPWKFFWESW